MPSLWWLAIVGALSAFARSIEARFGAKAGAQKLEDTLRDLHEREPEQVRARLDDFPHLDRAFYETTAQQGIARGFRLLADVEPKHLASQPLFMPTLVRVLTDDAGTTISIFNVRTRGWLRWLAWSLRDLRTCDLESELSDGAFVVTTNNWVARHLASPPSIDCLYLPAETTLGAVLDRHATRVAERLRDEPELQRVPITTFDEMNASQQRLDRIKREHQRQRGYRLTRAELQRFAMDSERKAVREAASDIADVYEGLEPAHPKPPPISTTIFRTALWLLLVVAFFVGYRLLQISER